MEDKRGRDGSYAFDFKGKKMTVFSKIINGEIEADKVYEDEKILVIKDINPVAPIHLLIIPKKPIEDLQSVTKEDLPLIGEVILVAQKLAKQLKIEKGYRLVTNNGKGAGQSILHLHFHLIGGTLMKEKIL